jgi:hypothetical protein
MGSMNSSGSIERFWLDSGALKAFKNQQSPYGQPMGNTVEVEVHGDENQDQYGNPVDPGSNAVSVYTSEDFVNWTQVGSTMTVVSRGRASASFNVGAFWKIQNAGPALAFVIAKPLGIAQVVPAL